MQFAKTACCQFAEIAQHVSPVHRDKLQVTGCPIRGDICGLSVTESSRAEAMKRLFLDASLKTLVVTGASLGAKTVNDAVLEALKGMNLDGWQILHLSGRDHADAVRAGYRELAIQARVVDFTAEMADVWLVADVAVSRSGASSCAELTACGIPSILMPYPYHKDLHQRANAKVLADGGAAVLLDDEKDRRRNGDKLRPILESLLHDESRRKSMGAAAKKLGHPDAANRVAQVLTQLAQVSR